MSKQRGPVDRYKNSNRKKLIERRVASEAEWAGGFVRAFKVKGGDRPPLICSQCGTAIEPGTYADLHVDKEGVKSYRHHESLLLALRRDANNEDDIRARRRARNAERREMRQDNGNPEA